MIVEVNFASVNAPEYHMPVWLGNSLKAGILLTKLQPKIYFYTDLSIPILGDNENSNNYTIVME